MQSELSTDTQRILDQLTERKLLFVTGKGGVGKSLSAVAIAQYAVSRGKRVLLVESSARDHLAPLFGREPVGHVETQVARNLTCINLSATGNFREYVTKYLGQKLLFDNVLSHRVVQSFFNTIPGIADLTFLGRLYWTCELSATKPDLLVCDSFASGHFLNLMTTPDAVLSSGLAGPILKDTRRVRDFLSGADRCGIVVVTTGEELVVSETLEFLPRLREKSPVPVIAMIQNRLLPQVGVPQNTAATQWLSAQVDKISQGSRLLSQGLTEMGNVSLSVLRVRDLGFVDDPLAENFWTTFWGRDPSS